MVVALLFGTFYAISSAYHSCTVFDERALPEKPIFSDRVHAILTNRDDQIVVWMSVAVFGIILGMEIEQVYREVAPKLQSYLTGNGCSYATACDVVQETFLRLWKRKDELSDDLHQVSGLAFTIARNYRNDLVRKARHEVFGEGDEGSGTREDCGVSVDSGEGVRDTARPGEAAEESAALRRRLKASLGRMPVELLETFALSRLGKLSVKDIASGIGASEANVKVRVHRAKEMLGRVMKCGNTEAWKCENGGMQESGKDWAVFRAVMMLAAVDGEIDKEEFSLYRELAEKFREGGSANFDALWAESVKGMAYIGFLSEMLEPEELVCEFVSEAGKGLGEEGIAALERMAAADGDYSRIERDCVGALAKISL